jgi:hypothetical protein
MPALSTWTPEDALLGAVAPLALAAAAGTALVVDLDPRGPAYGSESSLAELLRSSPRRSDLEPQRRGVAVLRNGGVEADDCSELLSALIQGWPAVVLRLAPGSSARWGSAGVVPVRLLLPAGWFSGSERIAVYQRSAWQASPTGPGPVLPRPRRATIAALLAGRRPGPDRWLRAWRQVWELAWT